jgi:hypothetical protein
MPTDPILIKTFDEAGQLIKEILKIHNDIQKDKTFHSDNQTALTNGDVVPMTNRLGATIERYSDAIKIYNALLNTANALNPNYEQMRKPLFIKIADAGSIHYDLEMLNNNIPTLAVIKIAKDTGSKEAVDLITDHLIGKFGEVIR